MGCRAYASLLRHVKLWQNLVNVGMDARDFVRLHCLQDQQTRMTRHLDSARPPTSNSREGQPSHSESMDDIRCRLPICYPPGQGRGYARIRRRARRQIAVDVAAVFQVYHARNVLVVRAQGRETRACGVQGTDSELERVNVFQDTASYGIQYTVC
jgi:hypothetical protein